jgi:cold shock CspA family protein
MKLPVQISFRNMERSPAVEELVRKKAAKLDQFFDRIMSCRVIVEVPHRRHEEGNQYLVRIDLTVPGGEIAVNRESPEHTEYRDIAVALRDAFDSARRKLEEYARVRRNEVKENARTPRAKVSKLFPEDGYGFLETAEGRQLYFHSHSVPQNAFARLAIGDEVTFVEKEGEKGPQASTVKPVGRHGGR